MEIKSIRIYAECLEQGMDFKDYLLEIDQSLEIYNIYIPKTREEILPLDSKLSKILKLKNFDLAISIITRDNDEIPILLIEYSTAVPTDDHKMQRSDVYFWSSVFKIPTMKISPFSKNSSGRHGGGGKLDTKNEQILALSNDALVYFIDFKTNSNNILATSKQRPSCISKNTEIATILSNILNAYKENLDTDNAYNKLLASQKEMIGNNDVQTLKNLFSNSTRFKRTENDDILVKINRFGHAMDPDRGILFFMNMLFGIDHVVTKFVIIRDSEQSYKSLLDGLPQQKQLNIFKKIKQNFTQKTALEIFQIATGIDVELEQISNKTYLIQDKLFEKFLQTYTNNVYKSIFINSKALLLCDYNENILCKISWNTKISKQYKKKISISNNYAPLPLMALQSKDINEDIITFASAKIFERLGCEILALSYPGAQGDRAILIGSGRTTKRVYIDIIASKKSDKFYVFLHENKDRAEKIHADIIKLNHIKTHYQEHLNTLLDKVGKEIFDELFLGIGHKAYKNSLEQPLLNVDYIFTFDLKTHENHMDINFSIGIVNLDLVHFFSPIANNERRLQGKISIDKIYKKV